jgi:DNA-binding SARP family transcriptional activator/tetratricopeptide (TPR) repeat protein
MSIRNQIILSQLNPPSQRSRVLNRERVFHQLLNSLNFPLTIIEAGTGYGKSTAILSFVSEVENPVYWYTISGTDRDPKLFLAKLFSAFTQGHQSIGDEPLRILDMPEATYQESMIAFVNALSLGLGSDSLLIIDDFHRVIDVPEIMKYMNWLLEHLPHKLHVILSTRYSPKLPEINKWRVKGRLYEINRETLAFTKSEIKTLFLDHYSIDLKESEIQELLSRTEGWVIGLQMIGQSLSQRQKLTIHQVLEDDQLSKNALFEYLAEEVFSGLSSNIQNFLLQTSILSKLDSSTCDFLLMTENSDQTLRMLHSSGFFIEEMQPGVYRYHQLFREFLINRFMKTPLKKKELHLKIASYFRAHEYWEETLFHLLSVGEYKQINQILESIGNNMIKDGRYESLNYWINEIPKEKQREYPYFNYLLGEINRYQGNFEEALEYYHIAERLFREKNNKVGISSALRGQAQVFLDTIRPINADQLLQNALKLLDESDMNKEVADLMVLTAENQLNLGNPDSSEALLANARALNADISMDTDLIQARLFLRTGRLQQGIKLLHAREVNRSSINLQRPQRFHREGALLLSLFYSIIGDYDHAEQYARQGIELGDKLKSTFVQSVGYMRLGHAILLKYQNPLSEIGLRSSIDFFQKAIDKVDVTRIHVEPLWGMCRALGYAGKLEESEQMALDSLEIAEKAGDIWISVLIHLSIGASAVLANNFSLAHEHLTTAETSAIKVKDPFVQAVARLWLAIKAWKQGYLNTAFGYLEKVIAIAKEHQYSFFLTQKTLMGLRDEEELLPLLISAQKNRIEESFIQELLRLRQNETLSYHPGYTLWVRTLGSFKVWRGFDPIERQDWKREKSLQLFQILIGFREKWISRDQILSMLWPETTSEKAQNYLKVVFSTLNDVLEPNRPKGENPYFILRNQERFRLNPQAKIIVDADLMIEFLRQQDVDAWLTAVDLYHGHYLSDSSLQEWLMIEEQYYLQQFLIGSERLIDQLINDREFESALELTYKVLGEDNLWESAYRAQMIIFHQTKRPSLIHKVFNHCRDVLDNQIQSQVSQKTIDLYQKLISSNPKI